MILRQERNKREYEVWREYKNRTKHEHRDEADRLKESEVELRQQQLTYIPGSNLPHVSDIKVRV